MSGQITRQFHDVYERLALQFGYETREDTKVFDPQSQNGRLMIAVCAEVIGEIERERDEARAALRFIAEWGGRTLESEYGDIECNGKWCAEQAKEAAE